MKENQYLKDQLIEEEKMRDGLDQYNRRENLEFHGIPLNPNENINHIIKTMAKKLNIDLKENDISTFHRRFWKGLPKSSSNNPPIIIPRFTNRDIRNLIFQKRKNLIGVRDYGIDGMKNLFINENLTPRRKKLFSLACKKKLPQNINFFGHTMVIYLSEKTPLVKESKSPANLILINFCKLWWFGLIYCRTFIKFLINFILTVKKNDKVKHNTEYIIYHKLKCPEFSLLIFFERTHNISLNKMLFLLSVRLVTSFPIVTSISFFVI